jgi:predicted transposase YdaD
MVRIWELYLKQNEETGNLPVEELNETVTQLFEEGGDLMATIAEKWIEQGIEKVVKNSLEAGLPVKTIERITGLPVEEINRVKEKMTHIV